MIELVCGMISSGKSTYCGKVAQEGWIVINDDAIVQLVHGGNYVLYSKDLKPFYKSIEDHIFHMAVAIGKNVIVDRGLSVSRHSRLRWIALAQSLDTPIRAVEFARFDPAVHARRRFESDPRGLSYEYWLGVANKHAGDYESPTKAEGFDSIMQVGWKDAEGFDSIMQVED